MGPYNSVDQLWKFTPVITSTYEASMIVYVVPPFSSNFAHSFQAVISKTIASRRHYHMLIWIKRQFKVLFFRKTNSGVFETRLKVAWQL